MSTKTVKTVKNSLKFKANVKANSLYVRVGLKRYAVPTEVRLLSGGEYLFLSFSANSELYKINGKTLTPMAPDADASEAYTVLNPGKRRGRRGSAKPSDLPAALESALKSIPEGYKLGYDPSGKPRLVRARQRRSKKA